MTALREALFSGVEPELEAVLAAREARVARRQAALSRSGLPAVSISPVMPGPVKDCPASRHLQEAALDALDKLFQERRWLASRVWAVTGPTGPNALIVVDAPAVELKRALIELEATHPLGRLWDLDVTDPRSGGLSRRGLGLPVRRCLICDEPAHVCSRSRAHSLDALLGAIEERIHASRPDLCAAR
jgi:holo-ACP synthase